MNKSQALDVLVEQAQRGNLIFSASVSTALKVQEAINDENCSLDAAAKIILNEPLLSAKVVAVANSAAYMRSSGEVTNVRSAITRLGFKTLRALVATIVMRQIAGASKEPEIRSKVNQLWEHSAQVAALAQILSHRVAKLDSETAMFAGIVHEVGGFYILSRAEEFPALLKHEAHQSNEEPGNYEDVETKEILIGRAVLKNIGLPQEVNNAVEVIWQGLRAMPPETLGDILLIANELAQTQSPLDPPIMGDNARSASEIDFVVGEGSLSSILEESEEEVHSLAAALII